MCTLEKLSTVGMGPPCAGFSKIISQKGFAVGRFTKFLGLENLSLDGISVVQVITISQKKANYSRGKHCCHCVRCFLPAGMPSLPWGWLARGPTTPGWLACSGTWPSSTTRSRRTSSWSDWHRWARLGHVIAAQRRSAKVTFSN